MKVGWKTYNLEDVCEILDNLRKPINSKDRQKRIEGKKESELYPYYGATGQVGFIDDYLTDGEFVLIGEDGAPYFDFSKNISYLIKGKTWVNNHAHVLKSYFNNNYLMHYLNQFNFNGYVSGTTRLKLTQGSMRKIPIEVAPFPEQRAIVSKIELLFSELDNGIANLKLAQEQLKVYRQAVLKKAFEGELTKKWREQQTDLPNAGDLLEQIRKEREKIGQTSGKKQKSINPLTEDELTEPPRLPEGWRWAGLGEIIDNIQAGKSIRCDERPPKLNELGIVKVSSVSWGEFDENESKTCFSEEAFNADYIIQKNDFLFSRANTIELVGACVIVKSISKHLMLSDKILKIDFSQNNMKFYSLYYLRSFFGRKEIESLATGNQESMRNIGQDRIKQIRIPICSPSEQQAIVQEIETRLSVCDKIEQDIKENLEKAEALRQSILKKAFEGKLLNERELAEVRGAEDWEPAEVLLERIRTERVKK
ncbi:MAG: restriction endonuclease subunit S [Methanosarcina sp.]